jgi:uncharacterized membrane protein
MDTKKFLTGTLVGFVTLWLLGQLIWGWAFADFFAANAGGATDLVREAPIYWPAILGFLAIAALVTLAIGWSGSFSLGEGFKIGAIVGFLVWFGVDFIHYANLDRWTLTATIADPILELIRTGIVGAVIGGLLGKLAKD